MHGTSATSEDTEADRSPEGYMLPSADKDERHISFRDIPSTSARMMRLLLHGAMFCGVREFTKGGLVKGGLAIIVIIITHNVEGGPLCMSLTALP